MLHAILFDLDGTITDSGEGIINCAAYALKHFGLPVPDRKTMGVFVGPPLQDTFQTFGVPAHKTTEAIEVFRSRYIPIGKYENTPYPGIEALLKRLKEEGHRLFIATSKPEVTAIEVLEHFQLSTYFEKIVGATLDGTRESKTDVIAYLLKNTESISNPIMVGDTAFDVLGAKSHGIPCVGVSWGYGKVADMEKAGAVAIASSMEELYKILST